MPGCPWTTRRPCDWCRVKPGRVVGDGVQEVIEKLWGHVQLTFLWVWVYSRNARLVKHSIFIIDNVNRTKKKTTWSSIDVFLDQTQLGCDTWSILCTTGFYLKWLYQAWVWKLHWHYKQVRSTPFFFFFFLFPGSLCSSYLNVWKNSTVEPYEPVVSLVKKMFNYGFSL